VATHVRTRARNRRRLCAGIAVLLVSCAGLAALTLVRPPASSATGSAVSVTMRVSFGLTAACSCTSGSIGLTATVTAPVGQSVAGVEYQYSSDDEQTWTTIPGSVGPAPGYVSSFDTTQVDDGDYDLQAVAVDQAGEVIATSLPIRDVIIQNSSTVLTETAPSILHKTVTLHAAVYQPTSIAMPTHVTYEWSKASADSWHDIGTVNAADPNNPPSTTSIKLDTTIADGPVDLRVEASDDIGDTFIGLPIRNLTVDNTGPTSTISVPAGPLSGTATLSATATDAGTGVSSVAFQIAPTGSGGWSTIGVDTATPYTTSFDTRAFDDGSYDFRVLATDQAGNQAASPVVSDVAISNPGKSTFGNFAITNFVVPATRISLIGEVANSPVHETWAYGYTTAPNYTAVPGDAQLVLLRYTDPTGWQVAGKLQAEDGSVYSVVPGATPQISADMTPSGDAWLVLRQPQPNGSGGTDQVAVFHKPPGHEQFVRDPPASRTLAQLLATDAGSDAGNLASGQGGQLELGQSADGSTYGLLIAPQQPFQQQGAQTATGTRITIPTQLEYGVLDNGAWAVKSITLPPGFTAKSGEQVSLTVADLTGPGAGWAAVSNDQSQPLMLAKFADSGSTLVPAGLDALNLTGALAATGLNAYATGIRADAAGVWLTATLSGSGATSPANGSSLVAHFGSTGAVTGSVWCTAALGAISTGCTLPIDGDHPASLPQGLFQTADGEVAEALGTGFVDLYSYGSWKPIAAPGFLGGPGDALFTSPSDGWIVGTNGIGRISAQPQPGSLALWPEPNRATLLSVALPPAGAGIGTSGALAVGLSGAALHYDATDGWLVDPTPPKAEHIGLRGVAFDGPGRAVAVGDLGTILDWNGSSWSEDPQSNSLTVGQLNAVAFAPDGEGWAVGTFGTILHWDGTAWAPEQIDSLDAGESVTSVATAGNGDVLAIAGGNLIERSSDGTWQRVSSLPSPAPAAGSLRLVSGLADGGAVAAGNSVLMIRLNGTSPWVYSDQPIGGTAVGLSAFRDPGKVEAFVSLAPSAATVSAAGFPAGDGDLIIAGSAGLDDLSRDQYPGTLTGEEGAVAPDPVQAVAAAPDGSAAWAVGGYAGTVTAAGLGTKAPLQARSPAWQTASIWRYDAGGSQQSTAERPALVSIPAKAQTITFAYFSSAECVFECASALDAQPDVNLSAATAQIASFARQPGGPAFAVLGGNAVGPIDGTARADGNGAIDLDNLSNYLAPLGQVPLYAAYGPLDGVPTSNDPATPWSDAFGASAAPFGSGSAPPGIAPVASGGESGPVHRYYAFDASRNGGVVRVIVLDNSAGSLDASDPGQSAWLDAQLAAARSANLPIVVFTARPLDGSTLGAAADGAAVAAELAAAGVLAVFTSDQDQIDREVTIQAGGSNLDEYQGATLGYQQASNNGVLWYFASIDTATRHVSVQAVPVVGSLALEPLAGLTVQRSSTLSFQAIGRRPPGTLATIANSVTPFNAGIDNYVTIPATPKCTGCLTPSYSFTSSDPTIGDFVAPSAPGSQLPALDASGNPIPSSTSGLFCAYNAGVTTVSVTSGQLTASQQVTVDGGGIGRPCGTVFRPGVQQTVVVGAQKLVSSIPSLGSLGGPVTPPTQAGGVIPTKIHSIVPPPPPPPVAAPAPPPAPTPARHPPKPPSPAPPPVPVPGAEQPFLNPSSNPNFPISAAIVPPITPPATPIPPGGATATSAVKREEKARKHASQSAFTIRPAGSSAGSWFIPAVAASGLAAVILVAIGLGRNLPERSAALMWTSERVDRPRRRPGAWR
jgi:hypothetical protein